MFFHTRYNGTTYFFSTVSNYEYEFSGGYFNSTASITTFGANIRSIVSPANFAICSFTINSQLHHRPYTFTFSTL
jgi:hypothetical protein